MNKRFFVAWMASDFVIQGLPVALLTAVPMYMTY